jgi:MerR family transcriptional regulator, copper efflux regulator
MKSSVQAELTIGELAAHFGLATHVLRHWEAVGLLQPARRVNGRRRYTREHVTRVAVILHGKEAGFSLDDLRELLAADPDGRRTVLLRHRAELERRIAQAQASKRLIDHALSCEAEDLMRCPSVQRLVSDRSPACPTDVSSTLTCGR